MYQLISLGVPAIHAFCLKHNIMADIKTGYTVNSSLWSFLNHFDMDITDVEIVVVSGN